MPPLTLKAMWLRLREAWSRRSGLATVTVYFAALEAGLLAVRAILRVLKPAEAALGGWIGLVGFCLFVCAFGLGFRWFRRILMWRLRNRLIITYMFIGVIPVVLLAAMAMIAAWLFAGQFATFVLTSDVHGEMRTLSGIDGALAANLAAQIEHGIAPDKAVHSLRADATRTLTVWVQAPQAASRAYSLPQSAPEAPLPPEPLRKQTRAIIGEADGLHLRAWTTVPAGRYQLTVIATQPLGKAEMDRIASDLGEVTVYPPDFRQPKADLKQKGNLTPNKTPSIVIRGSDRQVLVRNPNSENFTATLAPIAAGALPEARNRWDREVLFGTLFEVYEWGTGDVSSAVLKVRTRPSLLYGRLFAVLGDVSNFILILLAAVAVFFALIEFVALITGIRLTQTMTASVAALYTATQHINRGDLSHRIKVKRQDQLATLESSFNSMTESLERLLAEQKEKQRMESELAIAQEVQAQLFPRESSQLNTLEVHGVCRPARTVSGDYYDFLQLGPEKLGIAVGDISGKGISAALLMATIHSAVRVYEFGRMPEREQLLAAGAAAVAAAQGGTTLVAAGAIQSPATVLTLLNRHLFHSTPPEKYATLFLGLWNGDQHRLTYSNGGHLPPLVIAQDGTVRKLESGGMVIGLFNEMQWEEGSVELRPGDLMVAYSDGVTEPENEFGEFGEQRLVELVLAHRNQPLAAITDAVLSAVNDWIGGGEQPDDVTLVLARAR